jgi:sialic acid synthase SpsE
VFTECAQRLALRVFTAVPAESDSGESTETLRRTRIEYLFLTCLSRYPTDIEYQSVAKYLESQLSQLTENQENANAVIGEQPFPKTVATSTAAAWVALSRVILNLDEFITKE